MDKGVEFPCRGGWLLRYGGPAPFFVVIAFGFEGLLVPLWSMELSVIIERLCSVLTPLYDDREARGVARRVVCGECGLELSQLIADPRRDVDMSEARLEQIALELAVARPWQYVLGYEEFCGHRLMVDESVLIPRPETEELVVWAEESLHDLAGGRVVDIGSGSGSIAIALADRLPQLTVEGVDLSDDALRVAIRNSKECGVRVDYRKVDILHEELAEESYCAIISNPPYIPIRERASMHPNVVKHEPSMALFVPDDEPLLFYERIARGGCRWLQPGGYLFFEVHEEYGEECAALCRSLGYEEVELREDFNLKPRMIRCRRGRR